MFIKCIDYSLFQNKSKVGMANSTLMVAIHGMDLIKIYTGNNEGTANCTELRRIVYVCILLWYDRVS